MTTHTGTSGNDVIDGGNGADDIYGLGGDDIIYGGNGADGRLDGGDGNDQLYGQNGNDHLAGGGGDDLLDGNNGFDIAYYSGLVQEYTFLASAGYLHIRHLGGAGPDGYDKVIRVERLVFADRVINIGSGNNKPVAIDDFVILNEDSGTHNGGAAGVLANDFDFDGDAMSVTAGTFVGAYGTLTLNSNGTYTYTLSASAQALGLGDTAQDSFSYTVSDNDGSDTGALVFNIAGLNDAPTANPDSVATGENEAVLIDVLANDEDVDNGAILTVTAASAPAGQGSASTDGTQILFDPGGDFDSLAAGESVDVLVSYDISDEHGATSSSTATVTVTGENDAPVANPDSAAGGENEILLIDALANDTDVDNGAVLALAAASAPDGQGSASVVGGQVEFDPGADFDDLAVGESEEVIVGYTVEDEHGASASSTVTITVTGANDAPVANPDSETTDENSAVVIAVLANDEDVDNGAVLTVTASGPPGKGGVTIVQNEVRFDPGGDFESLAAGESEDVVLDYTVTDEHGATSSSTVTVTVTGANDGPVANPDTAAGGENETLLIDAVANDTDADDGAVLTLVAASAAAGQGRASVVGGQVEFDPGADFDDLELGATEEVIVSYTVEDEHGATASSTVTITVTGANDAPVANPDSKTTSENAAVVIDVLANDSDVDDNAVLTVTASGPAGKGTVTVVENEVRFDPGDDFDHLASGQSEVIILDYTVTDEHGATASSTVTVTVQGRDEGVSNTGTEDGETLIGTPGDDEIDALGGDDNVFGLAGDDLLIGGNGSDFLSGDEDDDTLEGGNDDDFLSGGEGNDLLSAGPGNDNASGGNGNDQLSGGDGLDTLSGGVGDDVIEGGADDDFLSGEEGDDQLSGQAGSDSLSGESGDDQLSGGIGSDSLDGGDGDDSLEGGDGEDYLSGGLGLNSLNGGLGHDQILANSSDGPQAIDGGGGNDTIRHHYRTAASTIATGSGSDSIEIAYADVGTAAIVVTDFTAGAGGDVVLLSGGDGSLLSLLSGWDGSSNPFGSGFLRLEQDGPDTLLQWDRDGASGGPDWETLMVFQNNDAGDFTGDNFEPGYHPDGSPPAGETITGTAEDDSLTGTVGSDTIDALAGNDIVSGLAGADTIAGGDGLDLLYGGTDDDDIEGGNDDDFLSGGDGDDILSGQAGNDSASSENGDDTLSGGAGDDSLDGGEGDDSLDGGDGDDFLIDLSGTNSFVGGIGDDQIIAGSADGVQTIDSGDGNDSIRHYYRSSASIVTTGGGRDSIEIAHADVGTAAIVVTDFAAGAGGDLVRLSGDDGSLLGLLSGWDGSSNPFGSGFLRLQQSGSDTLLQWDRDGASGGPDWETIIVFQNTDAADFTDANFSPGYDPDGSAPAGGTITGTGQDDVLTGTIGGDSINALGGNDVVYGRSGADSIAGGSGIDQLYGEADDDLIEGGSEDDILWGGDGGDEVSGQAGNDSVFGETGGDQLSGGDGDDSLDGGDGGDSLDGGDGEDFLTGALGSDILTGGAGADFFNFQSATDGPDEVTDFAGGSDYIRVSADGFGGGLTAGGPVSLVSGSNPTASEAGGQFLYDSDDGRLLWDADGTGSGEAVLVATLLNVPSLEASDFLVV